MPLHPDWKEFLQLLNSHGVEYLIVGAHARALYGIPRYTRDIDVFLRATPENAQRVVAVLQDFGFASLRVSPSDLLAPGQVIQLGVAPYRIDLLNTLSGLDFEGAWSDRVEGELDGVPVSFLSVRAFRKNKLAAGRPKDLADLADLLE
jgi:hypothetical protein